MALKKKQRLQDEIERDANRFLIDKIESQISVLGSKITPYDLSNYKEKGIDYIIEVEERAQKAKTLATFYLQNKGTDTQLKANKAGENIGLIPFQLKDFRQIEYFCNQLDQALVITVCDLKNKDIYWYPVQLDSVVLEERIMDIHKEKAANKRKTDTILIYISPKKKFCSKGKIIKNKFNEFLSDIGASKLEQVRKVQFEDVNAFFSQFKPKSYKIDEKKHVVDQLYSYLSYRFNEISHLPTHLFLRNKPFKKELNYIPNVYNFTLTSDNEALVEFLTSVQFINGKVVLLKNHQAISKVKDFQTKIKYIFKVLYSHQIFYVSDEVGRQSHNIYWREANSTCECAKCSLDSLNFVKTFLALKSMAVTVEDKFKQAYVNYEIGNFVKSYKLYKECASQAYKAKKLSVYFICKYNLSKMKVFIASNYWGDLAEDSIVTELSGINLESEYMKSSNERNRDIHEWLVRNSFYNSSRENIVRIKGKIVEDYYSQLTGGWSVNDHAQELISEIAKLISFLNLNGIVYNKFSEYSQLFESVTEGLLASHAKNRASGSRLERFDDFLVTNLIYNGNSNSFIKYFRRYNLEWLEYVNVSNSSCELLELFRNVCSPFDTLRKTFVDNCEKNNSYFWSYFNKMFSNCIVLIGVINFEEKIIKEVLGGILLFLRTETTLHRNEIEKIEFLMIRHRGKIGNDLALEYLEFAIKHKKYHDESFLATVSELFSYEDGKALPKETWQRLISIFRAECPECKYVHKIESLVHFYKHLDSKQRQELQREILARLTQQFDPNLYYFASIMDVVDWNSFWNNFLIYCEHNIGSTSFRQSLTGEKEKRNSLVDMLVNLAYKNGVPLNEDRFNVFRRISNYYNWLFDLNDFDYNQFVPSWIAEYGTIFYVNKFKTIPKIKDGLVKYLRENPKIRIEREYIDILTS